MDRTPAVESFALVPTLFRKLRVDYLTKNSQRSVCRSLGVELEGLLRISMGGSILIGVLIDATCP